MGRKLRDQRPKINRLTKSANVGGIIDPAEHAPKEEIEGGEDQQ